LLRTGIPAQVRAGELVYDSGIVPPVAAVVSGTVRVFMRTPGGRQFTVRYARAGDLIGVSPRLALVETTCAEAMTDVSLMVLPFEHIQLLAATKPELAWAIVTCTTSWAYKAMSSAAQSEHRPMTTRVAAHLLELAMFDDGRGVVHITHQRLADAVGTAREVVTRSLRVLRGAGVIATHTGRVVIVDRERLADVADGSEDLG
jgi:CRP/FNR family transcriptional regulator